MEGKELSRAYDKVEMFKKKKDDLEMELEDVLNYLDEAEEELEEIKTAYNIK